MPKEPSLSELKLPALRARCKELKIANYSKLNKAQLIERIREKEGCAPPAENAPAKKRKADSEHIQRPKTTKSSSLRAQQSQVEQNSVPGDQSSTAPSGPAITDQPPPPLVAPAEASVQPPATAAHIELATPALALPKSKSKPKSKTCVMPKVVLTRTAPRTAPATAPYLPQQTHSLSNAFTTPQDRIAHVEKHWLNRLCGQLHANRRKPILKPPFPGADHGPTRHLAFQGLRPAVYNLDEEAWGVALRFWIARLHTMTQLGSLENWGPYTADNGLLGPDFTTWPPVSSCEKVGGCLWKITAGDHYLVYGDIGEVLAHNKSRDELVSGARTDWQNALTSEPAVTPRIYTKDDSDFPGGVRRGWSKTASREALDVAYRTVLSSCVLNRRVIFGNADLSFTGSKLSAAQMDMEWRGEARGPASSAKKLEFYLPESHHVLSVHVNGDIAYVQRGSGFADIVLSETGQLVGNEDEGLAEVWQGLLGLDARGKVRDNGFWTEWEERMYA